MKKLFSIALALAVCFGLTSCGGGAAGSQGDASAPQSGAGSSQGGADVSQSEPDVSQSGPEESGEDLDALLAQAEEIDLMKLSKEHFQNLSEATGQMNGKVVKLTGSFATNDTDNVFFGGGYAPGDGSLNDAGIASVEVNIQMSFSEADKKRVEEAIASLCRVVVVGKIDEGVTEKSGTLQGMKDGENVTFERRTYCYTMSEAHFVTDTFEYTGTLEKFDDGEYGLTYSDGTGGNYVHFREGEEIPPVGTEITIRSKFVAMGAMGHMDAVIVK